MLNALAVIMRSINGLNKLIGNTFAWCSVAIVIVCFTVVVERYLFSTTKLWMQDLYVWINGVMFTTVAGFALFREDHVRVDIFYRPASPKKKALADLIGVCIFLFPFMFAVAYFGLPYVQRSWRLLENSANIGGMPGLYVLKTFILVFVTLVALQGLAMAIRSVLMLVNREDLIPHDFRYPTIAQATGKE